MDEFQPETARNTLKILQRLSLGVNYNIEQTCCADRDACKPEWARGALRAPAAGGQSAGGRR